MAGSATTVRAGRLTRRLALQSYTEARDSEGQPVKTWSTEATMWGSREPLRGREFFDAQTTLEKTTERIRVRYDPDVSVTAEKRFKDLETSELLDIESILNVDMANAVIEVMAVKHGD